MLEEYAVDCTMLSKIILNRPPKLQIKRCKPLLPKPRCRCHGEAQPTTICTV